MKCHAVTDIVSYIQQYYRAESTLPTRITDQAKTQGNGTEIPW